MKKSLLLLVIAACFASFQVKPLRWAAIGDSITYLNDHRDETGNRVTKGYMTRVTERLPNIQCKNYGFNGWTAGMVAEKIDSLGLEPADIYTVFLGTNDWWQGHRIGQMHDYLQNTGPATIYGSFRIIIDKLHRLNPSAKIILITPMQRGDFVYINDMRNNAYGSYKQKDDQSLEQVAEAVRQIGRQENVAVVDLYHAKGMGLKNMVHFKRLKDPQTGQYKNYSYPDYVSIPFHPETDDYPYPEASINITYDGLHPSDKGYQLIADKLIRIFSRIASAQVHSLFQQELLIDIPRPHTRTVLAIHPGIEAEG
jgi:lysophospholipase L1-like esterase